MCCKWINEHAAHASLISLQTEEEQKDALKCRWENKKKNSNV